MTRPLTILTALLLLLAVLCSLTPISAQWQSTQIHTGSVSFQSVTNALGLTGNTSLFLNGAGALASPGGGGAISGTVLNSVASAGLLSVDSSKTNGIAATAAHVDAAIGGGSIKVGGLTNTSLTASRVIVTAADKSEVSSATTATEIGYVNGVTSAIQTQLDSKASAGSVPAAANPTATISNSAVNGSAATFMRSDAAPALPTTLQHYNGTDTNALLSALGGAPLVSPALTGTPQINGQSIEAQLTNKLDKTVTAAQSIKSDLSLADGSNPKAFYVHNSYTDAANYERVAVSASANRFKFQSEAAGTGTLRPLDIYPDTLTVAGTQWLGPQLINTSTGVVTYALSTATSGTLIKSGVANSLLLVGNGVTNRVDGDLVWVRTTYIGTNWYLSY